MMPREESMAHYDAYLMTKEQGNRGNNEKINLLQMYRKQERQRLKLQAVNFALAYLFWVTVHIQRQYWSMSKTTAASWMSVQFLGQLDSIMFFCYSIS